LSPKRDIFLLTATVNQLMIEALDAFNAFIRSNTQARTLLGSPRI